MCINPNKGEGGGAQQGVMIRNLDINQVPSEELECWSQGVSVELVEEYDDGNNNGSGGPPRKKLRLTKEQSRLLEESFRHNHTLNPVSMLSLSLSLSANNLLCSLFSNTNCKIITHTKKGDDRM